MGVGSGAACRGEGPRSMARGGREKATGVGVPGLRV